MSEGYPPGDGPPERVCLICCEELPSDFPEDEAVCPVCNNTAREDQGLEPLPE